MGKFYAFVLGLIAGFGLYHLTSTYHVVRAADGLHVVGKSQSTLSDTYVDIRSFEPKDWLAHPRLAAAILDSDDEELKKGAIDSAVERSLRQALDAIPRALDADDRPSSESDGAQEAVDANVPSIDPPSADSNGTD